MIFFLFATALFRCNPHTIHFTDVFFKSVSGCCDSLQAKQEWKLKEWCMWFWFAFLWKKKKKKSGAKSNQEVMI